jgi:hypothetical protein
MARAEVEEAREIWSVFLALGRLKYGYRTTTDNGIGVRGLLETPKSIGVSLRGRET